MSANGDMNLRVITPGAEGAEFGAATAGVWDRGRRLIVPGPEAAARSSEAAALLAEGRR